MKAMPLPFEYFQGKGVLNFSSSSSSSSSLDSPQNWNNNTNTLNIINTTSNSNTTTLITKKSSKDKNCYVGSEPTSVLDTRRSPSSPTSSSTLSSSLGGGSNGGGSHSTDTTPTGVAAAALVSDTNNITTTNTTTNNNNNNFSVTTLLEKEEKCGLGMEDWESVLSESPGGQEQSILRLIMADVDDPSLGLNKLLQTSTTTTGVSHSQDMEFNAGFGVVDDQGGYGFEPSPNIIDPCSSSDFPFHNNNNTPNVRLAQNSIPTLFSNNLLPVVSLSPVGFPHHHMESVVDAKPQIFNNHPPQMVMINPNQAQFSHNPTSALVMPLTYSHLQEHHHVVSPPPAKRLNTGVGVGVGGANFQVQQQQLQLLSHQIRPTTASMGVMKQKNGGGSATTTTSDEQLLVSQQPQPHQVVQQAITDQLSKAAELIETGNPLLAQGILARLNHQLSPLGKPFQRAAFYFKEALLLLLQSNNNNNNPFASSSSSSSPFNLILKIGAYKTFSEISPVLQFANFTCNQAILEATEGFTRVHVIDFDIGYGGQWASFMQELALRNSSSGGAGNRAVSLKITAFASPSTHDEFELGFTQENLKHFASEINLAFELEILSLEMLNSGSWPLNLHVSDNEALAVNLPIGSFSNYPISLPLVLRFVKQLSPKIVVSLERGCDRTDVPFSRQLVHALHSYSGLLESLDAVNVNLDTMQKIEKCLLQPGIEKILLGRYRNSMLERMQLPPQPWRSAFLNSGFSPLAFSNFTESQAECLVQRTPVRGFHVEKKQSSSLVLCWQRKDLISASAWRC